VIHQELSAAGAGIHSDNFTVFGRDDYFRFIICWVGNFSGRPPHLADDFGRAEKLTITYEIATPCVPPVRFAVIKQPALGVNADLQP
jgi:hypothetical protein